jgi:hypothetical protein
MKELEVEESEEEIKALMNRVSNGFAELGVS